ncbi:MAG: diguanylate cyclase [Sterolibacterium sp.]
MKLPSVELFARSETVAALGAAISDLADLAGVAQCESMIELGWHLRQRDPVESLRWLDAATRLLPEVEALDPAGTGLRARVALVRAEASWLAGDLDGAETWLDQAFSQFAAGGNRVGCGDAQWLAAFVWKDRGDLARRDAALEAAYDDYLAAGDKVRMDAVVARLRWYAAFPRGISITAPTLRERLRDPPDTASTGHPLVDGWQAAAQAHVAGATGRPGESARYYIQAYDAMLDSGQWRIAVTMATNAGDKFAALNDLASALEWDERGLELARSKAWSGAIGACLMQTGHVLQQLGRLVEARALLTEAIGRMAGVSGSRSYAIALSYLGEVSFGLGDYPAALDWYRQCEARADALSMPDLLAASWRGQASVLARLGQLAAARTKAHAARNLAERQGNREWQIDALRVLADLYRESPPLPSLAGPDSAVADPLLSCDLLEQALAIAATIDGYLVPPDLPEALAREYAAVGDTGRAYVLSVEAGQLRERMHSHEAGNRAIAMQVRMETERMREEAEHHRSLALAQAERADSLQRANATLEQLGAIGREITENLDASSVFAALHRHIEGLLDVTAFLLYRLAGDGQSLTVAFGVEAGEPITPYSLRLDHPQSWVARCARRREEIVLDLPAATATGPAVGIGPQGTVPGTLGTRSLMFAPLLVGTRLLGVLTIQSTRVRAYAERERAILRTLCAYGAIALTNAEALAALHQAQAQLVIKNAELERLAATDHLTGLANRLFLDQVLQREFSLALRNARSFALILVDVDHFKQVNDRYGHPAGDAVLVAIADILRQRMRDTDVLGRWGGEEFLVICPDTDLGGVAVMAETLRAKVAGFSFPLVGQRTASFGVAAYTSGDTLTAIMARVDQGLYAAKGGGRNQVVAGH